MLTGTAWQHSNHRHAGHIRRGGLHVVPIHTVLYYAPADVAHQGALAALY